eukprot:TRINITY_DN121_c0_g1_i1.p1 TRINITY_DN121_c0_g1~~TRINITY_DN121_c0_g1_i1.p1  ORF type:complete len:179 (-),score=67.02 TRINITY_DN121_c0_g1_i1:62-598(-)
MNSIFKIGRGPSSFKASSSLNRQNQQILTKRNAQTIRFQLTIPPKVEVVERQDKRQEEIERAAKETLSGTPAGFYNRKVRITRPDPHPEQYGRVVTQKWEATFTQLGGDATSHAMTGYGGWTTDAGRFMRLQFFDKEQAIQWAEREGYEYEVIDKPNQLIQPIKNYGDNFKYKPPSDD